MDDDRADRTGSRYGPPTDAAQTLQEKPPARMLVVVFIVGFLREGWMMLGGQRVVACDPPTDAAAQTVQETPPARMLVLICMVGPCEVKVGIGGTAGLPARRGAAAQTCQELPPARMLVVIFMVSRSDVAFERFPPQE